MKKGKICVKDRQKQQKGGIDKKQQKKKGKISAKFEQNIDKKCGKIGKKGTKGRQIKDRQ